MDSLIIKNSVQNVSSRFDLILTAAKRARQMQMMDKEMMINTHHKHKYTVVALKEIKSVLINNNYFII